MVYSKEDIIEAIKQASNEVTDDCMMAGVCTLGAIILGISEDSLMEILNMGM